VTRIIAGTAGGRRLTTPAGARTRPTSDRVREAVFSTIAGWAGTAGDDPAVALSGLAFLDLYAGSGAVGLEAASRGASPVWAVESDARAARLIRANAASVGLSATVWAKTAEAVTAGAPPRPFDIVWADPPYALTNEQVGAVLAALVRNGWVADGGLVVVERSSRSGGLPWPVELELWAHRVYGETSVQLATKGGA